MFTNDLIEVTNYRTGKQEIVSRESLLLLANAIIINACKDYQDEPATRYVIEKFIKSDYFDLLSRSAISPKILIEHLRNAVKEKEEKIKNDNERTKSKYKEYAKRIH